MNKTMTVLFCLLTFAVPAAAADTEPVVFHASPGSLRAGERAILRASIVRDHKLDRVWLGVRAAGEETYTQIPFERADDDGFAAVLPRSLVQPPGLILQ